MQLMVSIRWSNLRLLWPGQNMCNARKRARKPNAAGTAAVPRAQPQRGEMFMAIGRDENIVSPRGAQCGGERGTTESGPTSATMSCAHYAARRREV